MATGVKQNKSVIYNAYSILLNIIHHLIHISVIFDTRQVIEVFSFFNRESEITSM